MAKVLFINPVIRQEDKPVHIPYGLAQLAAIVINEGHKVQVLDANALRPGEGEIRQALAADRWDVVAIGGLVTTYGFIKKTVAVTRRICKGSRIVAGGGFITPIPYEVMQFLPQIDIGVIGEGYITFPEILKKIDKRETDWENVLGIIFRNKYGKLHLNAERPLLNDVDSLPYPAWHLFPLEEYFKNSGILLSEEAMLARRHIGIIASYGCPFLCKYCFHLGLSGELQTSDSLGRRQIHISQQRRVRTHSPRYIVEMVKYIKDKFGVDFISIYDENFVVLARNVKWFDEFSKLWEEAGLRPKCVIEKKPHHPKSCKGIHWGATAHAALVTEEMLKRFKRLGCAHLDYGLESFSDKILKSIAKGASAKLNESAVKMTIAADIRPIPNQIIGFPDESFASILANINAWNRLGIQSYPFFATPYPGSEWFFTYRDRILQQYNGDLEAFLLDLGDATRLTAVISKEFNAIELLGLRELMVNSDIKRIEEYEKIWRENHRLRSASLPIDKQGS